MLQPQDYKTVFDSYSFNNTNYNNKFIHNSDSNNDNINNNPFQYQYQHPFPQSAEEEAVKIHDSILKIASEQRQEIDEIQLESAFNKISIQQQEIITMYCLPCNDEGVQENRMP